MRHKYEQTASGSIKAAVMVATAVAVERRVRTLRLTGWTGTPSPLPLQPPPSSPAAPTNDVWPVRETAANYIQDYKASVRGFRLLLLLYNTQRKKQKEKEGRKNNNWDSAAANCTKIPPILSL